MTQQYQRLLKALTADRKKLSAMIMLLAVALLLWGRVLIKQVPRIAAATDELPPGAQTTPSGADAAGNRASGENTVVYVEFPNVLRRDLFAVDPTRFLRAPARDQDSITGGKSDPNRADDDADDPARRVTGLQLQSTVLGQRPRAMINGQVVAVGEAIDGFVLKRILHRQVIVEKNGLAFRLLM